MRPTADDLIAALRQRGLRITTQRRAICEVLASGNRHLTVTDIHQAAQRSGTVTFDISTVYRTVEALEFAGCVHHVHLGHGPSVIHLTGEDNHHHLVCSVCGSTADIGVADLVELTAHIQDEYDFIVEGAHFALMGRCASHATDAPKRNSG